MSAAAVIASLDALPEGEFSEAHALVGGEAESLVLYRQGAQVRAWLNVCPHAGRRLDWAPGQFLKSKQGELVCAVHGATFAPGDGHCTGGPCRGGALRAVPVQVVDGQVILAG